MLLWGSCVLSFSYILGLVDPPTGSCRSTKGLARRAVQAVFPLYPSESLGGGGGVPPSSCGVRLF